MESMSGWLINADRRRTAVWKVEISRFVASSAPPPLFVGAKSSDVGVGSVGEGATQQQSALVVLPRPSPGPGTRVGVRGPRGDDALRRRTPRGALLLRLLLRPPWPPRGSLDLGPPEDPARRRCRRRRRRRLVVTQRVGAVVGLDLLRVF